MNQIRTPFVWQPWSRPNSCWTSGLSCIRNCQFGNPPQSAAATQTQNFLVHTWWPGEGAVDACGMVSVCVTVWRQEDLTVCKDVVKTPSVWTGLAGLRSRSGSKDVISMVFFYWNIWLITKFPGHEIHQRSWKCCVWFLALVKLFLKERRARSNLERTTA